MQNCSGTGLNTNNIMKDSLIIIGFFVIGTAVGLLDAVPFNIADTNFSFYALCTLMLLVGITIGNDSNILKSLTKINPRLILLPFITIIGTLTASALISFALPSRSITDTLAVASGFGYYSLSSIFITEYKGVELGTVALLANIVREITTLVAAPLLVKYFGKLASITAGGATTMDTTLPIITRYSGQQFIIISLFHGFVVDLSVPFLVVLFCSL